MIFLISYNPLRETTEQLSITASSVFFFGEMGINDYFLSLSSNRTVDETASLVPHVVGAIRSALTVITRRRPSGLPR